MPKKAAVKKKVAKKAVSKKVTSKKPVAKKAAAKSSRVAPKKAVPKKTVKPRVKRAVPVKKAAAKKPVVQSKPVAQKKPVKKAAVSKAKAQQSSEKPAGIFEDKNLGQPEETNEATGIEMTPNPNIEEPHDPIAQSAFNKAVQTSDQRIRNQFTTKGKAPIKPTGKKPLW